LRPICLPSDLSRGQDTVLAFYHFAVLPHVVQGFAMTYRIGLIGVSLLVLASSAIGDDLPIVRGVEAQPLKAQVKRVAEAFELLG